MTSPDPPIEPVKISIFCSSHKDDNRFREELVKHLSSLEGLINVWHKEKIRAGDDVEGEIQKHLEAAKVILLLISCDFISSELEKFKARLIKAGQQRPEGNEPTIIPIILRSCQWHDCSFLKQRKALPKNHKPINQWKYPDRAFKEVTQEILKVVKDLLQSKRESGTISAELKTPTIPSPDHLESSPSDHQLSLNDGLLKSLIVILVVIILLIPTIYFSALFKAQPFSTISVVHEDNLELTSTSDDYESVFPPATAHEPKTFPESVLDIVPESSHNIPKITTEPIYQKLAELLLLRQWEAADLETLNLMFKFSDLNEEVSMFGKKDMLIGERDILHFPCEPLQIIDELWQVNSNQKAGFSAQSELWKSLEGQAGIYSSDEEIFDKFANLVGWTIDQDGTGIYNVRNALLTIDHLGNLPSQVHFWIFKQGPRYISDRLQYCRASKD